MGNGCLSVGLQKARAGCEIKESEDKLDSAFLHTISESTSSVAATMYYLDAPAAHIPPVTDTASD